MKFSEQPPSKEWAALKYRGETIAEVWFKPEGEPQGLTFRVPQKSFQLPDLAPRLTTENFLRTVGIASDEVEPCRYEGLGDSSAAPVELGQPLPPPAPDGSHLTIHVRLKSPALAVAGEQSAPLEGIAEKWSDLESRWKAILGLEAAMETLRISMQALQGEMEGASKKALTAEEKAHAFNADLAQWNQAKSRVIYALPKVRDFLHRATWATGTPERKKLEELFKDDTPPSISLAQVEEVQRLLENLLKDRQVLSAQGTTVHQECKRVAADIQGAVRTLQSNAAANAQKKRAAMRTKGKSF